MATTDRRDQLATGLLGREYSELSPAQRDVVDLIAAEEPTSAGPHVEDGALVAWDRLADRVAEVGGSWTFLAWFAAVMAFWTVVNLILAVYGAAFDPYPFIFLNLVLSTLAAVQAPIILMSQNRQAARDRQAAEHDYRVNLRAELEIMRLHDRLKLSEDQLHRIEAAVTALNATGSS